MNCFLLQVVRWVASFLRNDGETQEMVLKWVKAQRRLKNVIVDEELGQRERAGRRKVKVSSGRGGADNAAAGSRAIEEVDLVDSSSDSEAEEGQLL